MTVRAMDHFTIVTDRLADTIDFYAHLGLREGPRPDFGIGGAWLYAGESAVLHLIEVPAMPAVRRGALDHMAFSADGLAALAASLRARGVNYRIIRTPRPFSRWQLFLEDPNGVEVELDFDIAEIPPNDWKMAGMPAGVVRG
jgi:catechol 2,3-dioxygenase-like lactoylglutathione lyase family enzyme